MGLVYSICTCVSAYLLWSDSPSINQVFKLFEEARSKKPENLMIFRNSIIEEITKKKFVKAITKNDAKEVLSLLNQGFPANSFINEEKFSALHIASKLGSLKIMKILLEKGNADINLQDEIEKWTPLMISSINGHYESVKYLIKHEANWQAQSETNMKAIDYAREGMNSSTKAKEKENFEKIINLLELLENKT